MIQLEDMDFDTLEPEYEITPDVILYNKYDGLIQIFKSDNLLNMSIDIANKRIHAEHRCGKTYDIDFYKLVIV